MKNINKLFLTLGLAISALTFIPAMNADAAARPTTLVQQQDVTMTPLEELQARQEIRALVDYYATESDKNNNADYVNIFAKNVHLRRFRDGKFIGEFNNVDDLIAAYSKTQSATKNSFHMVGHQLVEFENNNKAKGIVYTIADMVNEVDGKDVRSSFSLRYYDTYEKIDGRWWITERDQHFVLASKTVME